MDGGPTGTCNGICKASMNFCLNFRMKHSMQVQPMDEDEEGSHVVCRAGAATPGGGHSTDSRRRIARRQGGGSRTSVGAGLGAAVAPTWLSAASIGCDVGALAAAAGLSAAATRPAGLKESGGPLGNGKSRASITYGAAHLDWTCPPCCSDTNLKHGCAEAAHGIHDKVRGPSTAPRPRQHTQSPLDNR